jgi:cell shape-determining protein MreC
LPDGPWHQLVNTHLPAGQDIVNPDTAPLVGQVIEVQPRSSIVLIKDAPQTSTAAVQSATAALQGSTDARSLTGAAQN